ncbi:MAG: UbiX family flavin prenyltransferase [Pseudomonadota bacterium]
MAPARRIIVGVSGASGVIFGYRLLELLAATNIQTHLIVTDSAKVTMAYETSLKYAAFADLASVVYRNSDIAACIASGSYQTLGMIVAPCSMKTLAEIANGTATSLLSRAADVILKERRRLVLVARETPLSMIHLRNMLSVTEAGGIVYPPVPAFYSMPESIDDMVSHTVGRVLDLFDIQTDAVKRWKDNDA